MRPDWIDPWWQAVNLPERWDVCGLKLPNLSLWHTFVLEETGNAYAYDADPTIDDAIQLAVTCSLPKSLSKVLVFRPAVRALVQSRVMRKWRKRPTEDVLAACLDYWKSCTRAPSIWQSSDGAKEVGAPYQWHIMRTLCRDYGMTIAEAWDTPYALARCLYAADAESKGASVLTRRAQEMEDNWAYYKDIEGERKVEING